MNRPARIQKRTITVVSGHPSKLEVVMDGGHAENTASEHAITGYLDYHRERLQDVEAADDGQEEVDVLQQRQDGDGGPDTERTGIAHEYAGRRRVPPQKAGAGADHRRGHDRLVQGRRVAVHHLVLQLVEADDGEGDEREGRRAGGQPVQAIGQVDGVGEAHKYQHRQKDPPDLAQLQAETS